MAAGVNANDAVNQAPLVAAIAQAAEAQGASGAAGLKGEAATVTPHGTTILTAASDATTAQVSAITKGSDIEHAVIGCNHAITRKTGMTTGSQVPTILTNGIGIGNTHGIVVEETKTVLSGETRSTTLTLADNGLAFANAETGAAVVGSGLLRAWRLPTRPMSAR